MFNLVSDFKGWSKGEYAWLLVAVIATAIASYGGSWLDFTAAITNVVCVILVAKGRVSNYVWGLVGVLTYGWVAYSSHLYGNAALNLIYYAPLQLIGYWMWKKNTSGNADDVSIAKVSLIGWLSYALITVAGTALLGDIFAKTQDPMPYLDAFTTFGSVVAMYLMVKRHAEQWILWVLVDVATVYVWWVQTASEQRSYAMVAMWVAFTGNAVYGLWKWYITKENK